MPVIGSWGAGLGDPERTLSAVGLALAWHLAARGVSTVWIEWGAASPQVRGLLGLEPKQERRWREGDAPSAARPPREDEALWTPRQERLRLVPGWPEGQPPADPAAAAAQLEAWMSRQPADTWCVVRTRSDPWTRALEVQCDLLVVACALRSMSVQALRRGMPPAPRGRYVVLEGDERWAPRRSHLRSKLPAAFREGRSGVPETADAPPDGPGSTVPGLPLAGDAGGLGGLDADGAAAGPLGPAGRALVAWSAADQALGRLHGAARQLVGGLAATALSDAEQAAVTGALYARAPMASQALFDWEQAWIEALPPGPVFVGGAGAGREVAALAAAGHPVDALEPAAALAARCAPAARRILCADYAALTAGVLDDALGGGAPLGLEPPYAACLLGWGSLSHVLRAADRARLLEACHRLCPKGPILASGWFTDSPQDQGRSRAGDLGRRLGAWLAARRPGPLASPARQFTPWAGFGERLSPAELTALGDRLGSPTRLGPPGSYPHVHWDPPG